MIRIQHLDLYNIVIIRQHPEKKATEVENTMLSVVYVEFLINWVPVL